MNSGCLLSVLALDLTFPPRFAGSHGSIIVPHGPSAVKDLESQIREGFLSASPQQQRPGEWPSERWRWWSKPFWDPGLISPPVLVGFRFGGGELILVGIGMFTGGTIWILESPWPYAMQTELSVGSGRGVEGLSGAKSGGIGVPSAETKWFLHMKMAW